MKNSLIKTTQGMLTSRRIKAFFAAIHENGSMVSLAGRWVLANRSNKMEIISQWKNGTMSNEGLLTKVKGPTKDGFYALYQMETPPLADLFRAYGWRVISFVFPGKVKFAGRLRLVKIFSGFIYATYKHHGEEQTVKLLKASQLAISKAVAKDKTTSLTQLDDSLVKSRLTSSGLPPIIPSRDRKLIMGLAPSVIRFWLTLFSVYRVIKLPGVLKIGTIVAPSTAKSSYYNVQRRFLLMLSKGRISNMFNLNILGRKADFLLLETSSPSRKVAWKGLISDPTLHKTLGLDSVALGLMSMLQQRDLRMLYESTFAFYNNQGLPHVKTKDSPYAGVQRLYDTDSKYHLSYIGNPETLFAGKLSIKEEAAGKLRVFAMVDVWTQSILKPLERMLAKFLKSLPNDGVYDQTSSEKRARSKSMVAGKSWGYDLSAATDRLPIELQLEVLNLLLPGLGNLWSTFLVKREYYLYLPESYAREIGADKKARGVRMPNEITFNGVDLPVYYNTEGRPWTVLTYAVGQPMGALSSFAMLAVTHHFIVQLAYRNAYDVPIDLPFLKDTWYTGYECTGDDIILFDALVAKEYLRLLDIFGLPVNTTKSVVANTAATEYLKVTSVKGLHVAALSWAMFMSGNSLMGRVNILYSLLTKGVVRERIIPYIERCTKLSLYKEGNRIPVLLAIWTMLSNTGKITVDEALRSLVSEKGRVFKMAKAILFNADHNWIAKRLPGILLDRVVNIPSSKLALKKWAVELPWFKITLWKPLAVFVARHDPSLDAANLVREMLVHTNLSGLCDTTIEQICTLELDFGNFYTDGAPDVAKISEMPSVLLNDARVFYSTLYNIFLQKFTELGAEITALDPQMDSDSAVLALLNDKLARYAEMKELCKRASQKEDPAYSAPPARVITPTRLKLIQLLSKMGNRPAFTMAYS
jgi:hypothetical protein